jgi:hypothetical protein
MSHVRAIAVFDYKKIKGVVRFTENTAFDHVTDLGIGYAAPLK